MSYQLTGMFYCDCGKMHAASGIGPSTNCPCGISLWNQMWDKSKARGENRARRGSDTRD